MAEVIVALDLPGGSEALRLLDRLPEARWVKVGSILMTREGPDLIRVLTERGLRVFLDLKWHDIPNTVAEAVTAARGARGGDGHGPHAGGRGDDGGGGQGGRRARGARGRDGADVARPGRRTRARWDAARSISRPRSSGRAGKPSGPGSAGVVCSPQEVALVRARVGPDALDRGARDPAAGGGPGRPGPRGHGGRGGGRRRDPSGRGPAHPPGRRSVGRLSRAARGGAVHRLLMLLALVLPGLGGPRPGAARPGRRGRAGARRLVRARRGRPGGRQPAAPGAAAGRRPVGRAGPGTGRGAAGRFLLVGPGGRDHRPGGAGGRAGPGIRRAAAAVPDRRHPGVRTQSLLLGYRLTRTGWSLVELRVVG